jgi:predicted DNA-binding protein (UPF0251 family)
MTASDWTTGERPPQGHVDGHPLVDHLEELYAAACVYAPQPGGGEVLLRTVIPALSSLEGHHRLSAHRPLYHAAVLAEAGRTRPVVPEGSDPCRQIAVLLLPYRAALFLVDAADMRYADAAHVLDTSVDAVGSLVSSGRRQLVEACSSVASGRTSWTWLRRTATTSARRSPPLRHPLPEP